MPNDPNDTDPIAGGTPDAGAPSGAPAGTGSDPTKDPVSLLTSRLNGQTAKVGELTGTLKERETALAAANARIVALESGSVSTEEAANARVAAIQATLDSERQQRVLEARKARFPESFATLGDAAASLDEVVLAANEARLMGDVGSQGLPTPLKHNGTKAGGQGGPAKEESAADVAARLLATPVPW